MDGDYPRPQDQQQEQATTSALTQPASVSPPSQTNSEGGFYRPDQQEEAVSSETYQTFGVPGELPEEEVIEWSASEYVHHQKTIVWYTAYVAIAVVIMALVFISIRDIATLVVSGIAAVVFAVIANRPPRLLNYRIMPNGLNINNRYYSFEDYKSFILIDEGASSSVMLVPLKRFGSPLNIYYSLQDEERVVDAISQHLPVEVGQLDVFEQLMRKLRF